ncbi:single-stranded DNA-binding protein [Flavobacterium subsaxonicum]|uniref:Single-stranded DNA-binding protein n=1 Tax=Flavobacterium subsaxonicum WB 4.1-42 = DSM 21790 TaxID=1121898 RepID=A0A0A2MPY8_9FLAO|nr:single-stranded DNA-binding protein [Flavobacterium subsaxonicum]KGO93626.1 single-stranded DNA-binding protein [Flavobacterium subsaxonicum WB 4.1-42 = DSM 21790]
MEITGRVTEDAAVNVLNSGSEVVNFSIAINDSYKPKGSSEVKQLTTYIKCAYWLNTNTAKVLRKGAVVQVSGRIGVNVYNNAQGEAKGILTFHTNNLNVIAYAKNGEQDKQAQQAQSPERGQQAESNSEEHDDLPF